MGEDVVREYYKTYNSGDIQSLENFFDADVVYEDLVYQDAYVGRVELMEYLKHVYDGIGGSGVKFIIDDVADSGDGRVGITW